jgi:hypothetical protein
VKFKTQQSVAKVMLFDINGPMMLVFKDPNITINKQHYCGTL